MGYKDDIGYQTFLYFNETEMRRLLMFLVEKTNKSDVSVSSADSKAVSSSSTSNRIDNINLKINQRLQRFILIEHKLFTKKMRQVSMRC